jgi:hypothetical protein
MAVIDGAHRRRRRTGLVPFQYRPYRINASGIRRPPAGRTRYPLARHSAIWEHFVRYLFLMLLRAAAVCACSVVGLPGATGLAPRRAVPSSGTTANGPTRLWRKRRGSARRAGVSLVEAAGPLSPPPFLLGRQTSRPTPVECSGDAERAASRWPLHAKNPAQGWTSGDLPGRMPAGNPQRPPGPGRPVGSPWSRCRLTSRDTRLVEPTSRRPAWTPVSRPVAAAPAIW